MENSLKKLSITLSVMLFGFAGLLAMDPPTDPSDDPSRMQSVLDESADSDQINIPTPTMTRNRDSWKAHTPQLRNRNNAQLNNCGYIAVAVSLRLPMFFLFVDKITNELKLQGDKLGPDEYVLNLFSFSVPITDELVAHIPKTMGVRSRAKYLRQEEKQIIVDHVKAVTNTLIEHYATELIHGLELAQVVTENGNATAYFYEPEPDEFALPPINHFERAMNAIRTELEKHYRWGKNKQDGVWFSFKDMNAVRPSLQFLTAHQPELNFLQRVVQQLKQKSPRNSGGEPLSRNSASEINPQLSRGSKAILLSRGSDGDATRPLASLHRGSVPSIEIRNGKLSPTPNRSPNISPGRSPNHSPPGNHSPEGSPRVVEPRKVYAWPQRVHPVRLVVTMPQVDVQIQLVDEESGKC